MCRGNAGCVPLFTASNLCNMSGSISTRCPDFLFLPLFSRKGGFL
jgi:hypothetical protein